MKPGEIQGRAVRRRRQQPRLPTSATPGPGRHHVEHPGQGATQPLPELRSSRDSDRGEGQGGSPPSSRSSSSSSTRWPEHPVGDLHDQRAGEPQGAGDDPIHRIGLAPRRSKPSGVERPEGQEEVHGDVSDVRQGVAAEAGIALARAREGSHSTGSRMSALLAAVTVAAVLAVGAAAGIGRCCNDGHLPIRPRGHGHGLRRYRGVVVLFGGLDANSNLVGDTWTWTAPPGRTNTRPPRHPPASSWAWPTTKPEGRSCCSGGSGFGEILATRGPGRRHLDARTPGHLAARPLRHGHGLRPSSGEVVLFGGYGGGPLPLGDTWTWDGTTWTQEHPATSPSARIGMGMAYDQARGEVVLFGGYFNGFLGDTWNWTARPGRRNTRPPRRPPLRHGHDLRLRPG